MVKATMNGCKLKGEEGEEIKKPEVESEETQDYVREVKDTDQKDTDQLSFVPSAISVPRKPMFRCGNQCIEKPSASGS